MYTKQNLIDSVTNEFRIIKHLAEKVTPEMESYKPTDGQRTTLEILQYLSTIIAGSTKVILAGTTDAYKTIMMKPEETTIANFSEKMDAQLVEWQGIMDQFTDEEKSKKIQ